MFNMVSLDGFFADEGGGIGWHTVDDEFNRYAVENLETTDTIIFGRITYDMFESYWPKAASDPATSKEDRLIADGINRMRKIVFSKTKNDVTWDNSELVKEIDIEEIRKLKAEDGKNIIIFGSGSIVQQLSAKGLIDEYSFMISPTILGSGKPLLNSPLNLKLQLTRSFSDSGNVLLIYVPKS